MRRVTIRLMWVMTLCAGMPALAHAQTATENGNSKMAQANLRKLPPVVADLCPYRAATPYNPIYVNRPVPNPALNMTNLVLCCDIPNIDTSAYVAPPCDCGGCLFGGRGCGNSCGSGCDNGCGAIFGRVNFGRGCQSDCNSCDRGFRGWQRFGCGRQNDCGCDSGCNSCQPPAKLPAPAPAPNVKPVSNIEQVGWFLRTTKPNTPGMDCLSCPPTGPKPKHVLPTASGLSCNGCSTWESEAVFVFGTCRQFFGEPTHRWLNGKEKK